MKFSFYLRYAWRSLRREGQRTLLAIIAIAFGVASLAGLGLVAGMVRNSVLIDPRNEFGGDLMLETISDQATPAMLDQLKADGVLADWMAIDTRYLNLMKNTRTNDTSSLNRLLIIDPAKYPIVGTLELNDQQSLEQALREPHSAIVTRDLVAKRNVHIGDEIMLVGFRGGEPQRFKITAIADHMPDQRGDTLLIRLPDQAPNLVLATLGAQGQALQNKTCDEQGRLNGVANPELEQTLCKTWLISGIKERSPSGQKVVDVFNLMLNGAGILGLLVGGIGVANTLQVLLTRRRTELAILATQGYQRRDIISLIAVETALLGGIGSLLGSLGAIALAYPLANVMSRTEGTIMLDRSLQFLPIIQGALAGIATAVIFGLVASVRASAVRPAMLLRNQQLELPQHSKVATLGLWAVLAMLFAGLSSLILGSVLQGIGVVLLAIVGLGLLGGLLAMLLKLIVFMRTRKGSLFGLAQHNLKRQGLRPIFAMIALWIGIFAIGFAMTTLVNAREAILKRTPIQRTELTLYAAGAEYDQVHEQFNREQINGGVRLQTTATIGNLERLSLETRNNNDLAHIEFSQTSFNPNYVYIAEWLQDRFKQAGLNLQQGDSLTLHLANGNVITSTFGGFFMPNPTSDMLSISPDMLISADLAQQVQGAETTVFAKATLDGAQLNPTIEALNQALPNAMIISSNDMNNNVIRAFQSLFGFVILVASLALLAGVVLIMNSVGLALLERRREVGILKAVGFTSTSVLRTLIFEYLMLGILGGGIGLLTVYGAVMLINLQTPGLNMHVPPILAATLLLIALALTIGSTILVAWRATRVRPLQVLREG